MNPISERLAKVRERITLAANACGRNPDGIRLLAVSKTKPPEDIRAAYAAGQRAFGENYLQDAVPKILALDDLDIEWHFIGRLQGNKTDSIARHFAWVHSLEKIKHAQQLDRHRAAQAAPLDICIQLNLSGETSKGGIGPDALPALAAAVAACPRLCLRGLMTLPDPLSPAAAQVAAFEELARLLDRLRADHPQVDTLSIGMSADLEAAIRSGSTLVRIGTDIFGPRA